MTSPKKEILLKTRHWPCNELITTDVHKDERAARGFFWKRNVLLRSSGAGHGPVRCGAVGRAHLRLDERNQRAGQPGVAGRRTAVRALVPDGPADAAGAQPVAARPAAARARRLVGRRPQDRGQRHPTALPFARPLLHAALSSQSTHQKQISSSQFRWTGRRCSTFDNECGSDLLWARDVVLD